MKCNNCNIKKEKRELIVTSKYCLCVECWFEYIKNNTKKKEEAEYEQLLIAIKH